MCQKGRKRTTVYREGAEAMQKALSTFAVVSTSLGFAQKMEVDIRDMLGEW